MMEELKPSKIDFQSYPRYDKDTLTRKVHAVIGPERFKIEDPLTDEEWERVFKLCEREYRFRRIPIISSRTMHRLEAMSADRIMRNESYLSLRG